MRIALIKQDVYQDLYIGDSSFSAEDLLFSSIMRVGPIGLVSDLHADFYIVKEENTEECQIWKQVLPEKRHAFLRKLKEQSIQEIKDPDHLHLRPGSSESHKKYAVSYKSIPWEKYDVVVSMNVAIPTKFVQSKPEILWTYMIGEANHYVDKNHFGYDVTLNQQTRGIIGNQVLDFPYTFVGANTLENILRKKLGRATNNSGIYAEVNTTEVRPVRSVPHYEPLKRTGHDILLHQQGIADNLTAVYDAKYFIKVGGRFIRGNSFIEAISLGTLVLARPEDVYHTQVLPKSCWVHSIEEAEAKINELDQDPELYKKLLQEQKALVQLVAFDLPLRSLELAKQSKKSISVSFNQEEQTSKFRKIRYYVKKYIGI